MRHIKDALKLACCIEEFKVVEYRKGILHRKQYSVVSQDVSVEEVAQKVLRDNGTDLEELNVLEVKKVQGFDSALTYCNRQSKLSYLLNNPKKAAKIEDGALGFILMTNIGYFTEGLDLNSSTAFEDVLVKGRTCCNTNFKYVVNNNLLTKLFINKYTEAYAVMSRKQLRMEISNETN